MDWNELEWWNGLGLNSGMEGLVGACLSAHGPLEAAPQHSPLAPLVSLLLLHFSLLHGMLYHLISIWCWCYMLVQACMKCSATCSVHTGKKSSNFSFEYWTATKICTSGGHPPHGSMAMHCCTYYCGSLDQSVSGNEQCCDHALSLSL